MRLVLLKHLAQEYEVDPYLLRRKLRLLLGSPKNKRWKWSADDPQLTQIKALLKKEYTHAGKRS